TLTLAEEPGTVWTQEQTISGTVTGVSGGLGTISVGDRSWPLTVTDNAFTTNILLEEGVNSVIARWEGDGGEVVADTVELTLGYTLRPEAQLEPSVSDRTVTLTGSVLANPDSTALTFEWEAAP